MLDLATVSMLLRTIRRVLRPIARPFLRPFVRRIEELEDRLNDVSELVTRLDHHLPIVESVIESQNSALRGATRDDIALRAEVDRLRREVEALRERVESGSMTPTPPLPRQGGGN
jgi:DNA-binding GntR family transcriptional regulator